MRLLLHICCAPCLIYPLQVLREEGLELEGFFYNPNIHPFAEYERRRQSLENFSEKLGLKVTYHKYSIEDFFRPIAYKEREGERCQICWYIRLKKTAQFGCQNKFDLFTTTLLVSPYQDQERLLEIGQKIAREENIRFHYCDFRQGYRDSVRISKQEGLYRQKYCGCLYSERERFEKVNSRQCTVNSKDFPVNRKL